MQTNTHTSRRASFQYY